MLIDGCSDEIYNEVRSAFAFISMSSYLSWNAGMLARRNPVGLLALVLFASMSVFGQGLHFLPSANHFSDHAHACGRCHHHHGTGSHGTGSRSDSDATLGHDCSICRFLAQAQIQSVLRIELPLSDSCELSNERQSLRLALPLFALHLARAPPLFSLS